MANDVVLLVAREPLRKPVVYDLLLERYVVGREQGCDIVVDSSPEISRKHLELQFRDGVYWAVPEGKGGTWFKGKPVSQPKKLSHGDVLKLPGDVRLQFVVCGSEERARVVERIVSEQGGARPGGAAPKVGKGMIAYFVGLLALFVLLAVSGSGDDEQDKEERLYRPGPEGDPVLASGRTGRGALSEATLRPRGGDIVRSVLNVPDSQPVDWVKHKDAADVPRMIELARARCEREEGSLDSRWRYLEQLVDFCGISHASSAGRPEEWNLESFRKKSLPKDLLAEIDRIEAELKKEVDARFLFGDRLRRKEMYREALREYGEILRLIPDRGQPAAREAQRVAAVCRTRLGS